MLLAPRFSGRNLALLAAIALVVVWGAPLHAQNTASVQDIDLAVEGPGDLGTEPVFSGRPHRLRLHHLAPNRVRADAYTITMVVRTDTLEPLRIADVRLPPKGFTLENITIPNGGATAVKCDSVSTATNAAIAVFNKTDTEAATRTSVAVLRAAYASEPAICQTWVEEHVISATELTMRLPALRRGQTLTLTISTQIPGGTTRQWRRAYSTGPRGHWRPVYSFSFIGRAINERKYFARQSESEFIVTRERNRDWADFVPSVFFTWTPTDADLGKMNWMWSGGLGFDMRAPVVMIGRSGRYNENIMLSLGVALHGQQVLLGRYNEGDTLSENLTETQLHSPSYRPNPYLSIGFRFGANPFSAP